jgi:hypothetical protein
MFQGTLFLQRSLSPILRPAYKFFKAMNWFSENGAQISGASKWRRMNDTDLMVQDGS